MIQRCRPGQSQLQLMDHEHGHAFLAISSAHSTLNPSRICVRSGPTRLYSATLHLLSLSGTRCTAAADLQLPSPQALPLSISCCAG